MPPAPQFKIEVVPSPRPADEDSYWRSYTYGVPGAMEAVYPRAHLVDAAFRYSSRCDIKEVPPKHRNGCLEMLAAGWVPDSLGKPGSPSIGLLKDQAKAAELHEAFRLAMEVDERDSFKEIEVPIIRH